MDTLKGNLPSLYRLLALVCGLLTLIAVLLSIDRMALRHLTQDAESSAVGWAEHLARSVPDLDLVLEGELPSPIAQGTLAAMRGTAGLFRFKLYDANGRAVLQSESLGTAADASEPPAPVAIVAGGHQVELKHGNGDSLPLVYSEAFVPVHHQGRIAGAMGVYVDQTQRAEITAASFRNAALLASGALIASFAVGAALWRRRLLAERLTEERLHYLAEHDPLTGALNLPSFREQLQQACTKRADGAEAGGLAVLTVDIDHFKDINDRYGQAGGDQLLAQTTERLRSTLRSGDALARLGGDRFGVLQQSVAHSGEVEALTSRILKALSQPYLIAGVTTQVTASVGAAILGVDGDNAERLTQRAELALLRARADGRGGYSFYDPVLDGALQRRRQLALDLAQVLQDGGLQLHYQPLYRSQDGQLLGYEALARWQHPLHGAVSPGEFIPLAEECGLIRELGRWVLATACREAASWPGSLSVAVNLSAAQFQQGTILVEQVRAALTESRLAPARLELEITESLLMSHTDQVLLTLRALHHLGLKIGMDDFGTGFSSLAYLWRFPFDKLKIDRAFTQGLENDPKVDLIVHSIISLAHALGMRVNAEGVETEGQRHALQCHGCDELQGFLLGRPQPVGRLAHEARREAAVP
jgi:diguanylate cyclase (GGDEF)-like protein